MVASVDFFPLLSCVFDIVGNQNTSDRVDEAFNPESQGLWISFYFHLVQMHIMNNEHQDHVHENKNEEESESSKDLMSRNDEDKHPGNDVDEEVGKQQKSTF